MLPGVRNRVNLWGIRGSSPMATDLNSEPNPLPIRMIGKRGAIVCVFDDLGISQVGMTMVTFWLEFSSTGQD